MSLYLSTLYGICGFILLFLGGIVLKFNHEKIAHKIFFLFSVSAFLWMASLYLGYFFSFNYYYSLLFLRFAFAFPIFWYGFLTLFFYFFPKKTFSVPNIYFSIFIVFSVVFFLITAFTPLVYESVIIENNVLVGDVYGHLYSFYIFYLYGHLIISLVLGLKKMFILQGIEKRNLAISFCGSFTFLFFVVLTNVILPIWHIIFFVEESVLFTLFFAIPTFYSMQQYRFLNISYKLLNYFRLFILFAIILGGGILFFLLLKDHIAHEFNFITSLIGAFVLYFAGTKLFPEFVPKEFQGFKDILEDMKISIYDSESYEEFLKKLENIFILQLHFSFLKVLIVQKEPEDLGIPGYLADGVSDFIEKRQYKILTKDGVQKLGRIDPIDRAMLEESLENLQADMLFCFYINKKLRGFLVLGNQEESRLNTPEYREEFTKTHRALEIAFVNILLKKNLQQENNVMKKMIQSRTAELRQQYQDMKYLVQQQSDFIALTSHEFRTPLSIAMFQLEDTLESHKHDADVVEELDDVVQSLDRLKTLTEKLFNVEQYDLNKIQIITEKILFVPFLQKIFVQFQNVFQEKNIHFFLHSELGDEVAVLADESQLTQLFHNLLGNAHKFTPRDGSVEIRCFLQNRKVYVEVTDSGDGIPDEDKPTIFQKFRTVDIARGMGLGLGLYVCKKIAELHQGEISVEDDPILKGAKFVVILPIL